MLEVFRAVSDALRNASAQLAASPIINVHPIHVAPGSIAGRPWWADALYLAVGTLVGGGVVAFFSHRLNVRTLKDLESERRLHDLEAEERRRAQQALDEKAREVKEKTLERWRQRIEDRRLKYELEYGPYRTLAIEFCREAYQRVAVLELAAKAFMKSSGPALIPQGAGEGEQYLERSKSNTFARWISELNEFEEFLAREELILHAVLDDEGHRLLCSVLARMDVAGASAKMADDAWRAAREARAAREKRSRVSQDGTAIAFNLQKQDEELLKLAESASEQTREIIDEELPRLREMIRHLLSTTIVPTDAGESHMTDLESVRMQPGQGAGVNLRRPNSSGSND